MSKKEQLKNFFEDLQRFIEQNGFKYPNSKFGFIKGIQLGILSTKMRIHFLMHGAFGLYKEMYLLELRFMSIVWSI